MADFANSWRDMRDSAPSKMPGPDNIGWWSGIAFLVAVILHVGLFLALGQVRIALGLQQAPELRTAPVAAERVVVLPPDFDVSPPDDQAVPEDVPPLLEEIDLLSKLSEPELDMKPNVDVPEYAARLADPVREGDPESVVIDPSDGFEMDLEMPEIGKTPEPLPVAAEGQVIVDPGGVVEDPAINDWIEDVVRKGVPGGAEHGRLDGAVTLDEMIGLPADVLVGKMTMLPSDLLFEYDRADLRESARQGLMKLALLIDRNPNLYCWIEGHTDLFGTDAYNDALSEKRAQAVKTYLTQVLRLPGDKIVVRGYGRTKPLVAGGGVEEQAPNRRVEIRLRKQPPPPKAQVVEEPRSAPVPEPKPPMALPVEEEPVLVKPARALPVEEVETPKARMVEETPPPRAREVEEKPLKAQPVEEDPPRALEVEE